MTCASKAVSMSLSKFFSAKRLKMKIQWMRETCLSTLLRIHAWLICDVWVICVCVVCAFFFLSFMSSWCKDFDLCAHNMKRWLVACFMWQYGETALSEERLFLKMLPSAGWKSALQSCKFSWFLHLFFSNSSIIYTFRPTFPSTLLVSQIICHLAFFPSTHSVSHRHFFSLPDYHVQKEKWA